MYSCQVNTTERVPLGRSRGRGGNFDRGQHSRGNIPRANFHQFSFSLENHNRVQYSPLTSAFSLGLLLKALEQIMSCQGCQYSGNGVGNRIQIRRRISVPDTRVLSAAVVRTQSSQHPPVRQSAPLSLFSVIGRGLQEFLSHCQTCLVCKTHRKEMTRCPKNSLFKCFVPFQSSLPEFLTPLVFQADAQL